MKEEEGEDGEESVITETFDIPAPARRAYSMREVKKLSDDIV